MSNEKPLSIVLSQEELIFLLRIVGVSGILGMGLQSLQELDTEQFNLLMGSAERTLIARQFLSMTSEDSLTIDRVVLALLGPCIIPEKSIIVTLWEHREGSQAIYYHNSGEMLIEHLYLGNGLHHFAALTGTAMLLDRLADYLQIGGQGKALEETSLLTMQEFRTVLERIRDNGLSEPFDGDAGALKDLLESGIEKAEVNANIVVVDHLNEGEALDIEAISLLLGPRSIWRLDHKEIAEGEEQVSVTSLSFDSARELLKRMVLLNSLQKKK